MAGDTVTTQLLENGPRWWAYSFTDLSDGTGETGVVKVDGSASGPLGVVIGGVTLYPLSHIKIREVQYSVTGMQLSIIWDASSSQNALVLEGYGSVKFDNVGGLAAVDASGAVLAGATGKIKFTTANQSSGSTYSIVMRGTKGIHQ